MRRRSIGGSALAAFAVVGSLLAGSAPAQAVTVAGTPATAGLTATSVAALSKSDQRIASMLTVRATNNQLGNDLTAQVTDGVSKTLLWQQRSGTRQLPASTTKLVTCGQRAHCLRPGTPVHDHRPQGIDVGKGRHRRRG